MDSSERYLVHPIGIVRSTLRAVADAPNQTFEGAPEALLEIDPAFADALHRVEPGDELIVVTWLHLADRETLHTHPTGDVRIPLTGVFRTRSPDRPNPVGLHRVTVTARDGATGLRVGALEVIDGTLWGAKTRVWGRATCWFAGGTESWHPGRAQRNVTINLSL